MRPDRHSTTAGLLVVDLGQTPNAQVAEWLVDLAGELRQTDLDEIAAMTGHEPAVALVSAVMVSDMAWTVIDADGEPIAAFGSAPSDDPNAALVWMVGSPRMDEPANALGLLRLTKPCLDRMQNRYTTLWNWIDARNERSMAWLRWAGFEVGEIKQAHGVQGRPFIRFSRTRADV